jgi:hypothetical protein
MSCLIFCSNEIGGFPFKIAEILNHCGIETYYISLHKNPSGHDSTKFHYGEKQVPWDLSNFVSRKTRKIKALHRLKKKYSIKNCIATGGLSYLLRKAHLNYNYWSFGSDLDLLCFKRKWTPNLSFWQNCLKSLGFYLFIKPKYRKSILKSDALAIAPYQYNAYKKIVKNKKLFFLCHVFQLNEFDALSQLKKKCKMILQLQYKADHVFFSSTRHVWHGFYSALAENKGNDIMVSAFYEYLNLSKNYNDKLVLIRKGLQAFKTLEWVKELGIETNIIWIEEMKRDALVDYYRGADICFGQFGTPVLAYSALEPIAQATPTISSFMDGNENGVPFYKENPPIFNSKSPQKIAHYIYDLMNNRTQYQQVSFNSWTWIKKNCNEKVFSNLICESFNK